MDNRSGVDWKSVSLVLSGMALVALLILSAWASVEACKNKHPGASTWACIVSP